MLGVLEGGAEAGALVGEVFALLELGVEAFELEGSVLHEAVEVAVAALALAEAAAELRPGEGVVVGGPGEGGRWQSTKRSGAEDPWPPHWCSRAPRRWASHV